jgi:hypothetical protein
MAKGEASGNTEEEESKGDKKRRGHVLERIGPARYLGSRNNAHEISILLEKSLTAHIVISGSQQFHEAR